MAQYKGIVFFSGGFGGWSERYFLLASTPSGAVTNLSAVITARQALLSSLCGIGPAYISDVAIRGDSIVVQSLVDPGGFADATGYMDLDVAVMIKWQVGVFNRNKTYLRGIPLGQTFNGTFAPTTEWATALISYKSVVMANCVMPVTTRNPTPPPNYLPSSYAPITAGSSVANLVRRKSGRPFGLPRGRRVAP